MGRMTTAMWWSGLILLFASGLLFGLAVAQAETNERQHERCPVIVLSLPPKCR
jgi:hypothetical protein